MEPKIDPTVDTEFLQQVLNEIKATQSLSEERIRQIVREEIEQRQKQHVVDIGDPSSYHVYRHYEVK